MEPTPYGLVAFRANNMAPLRKVLLTAARPWIKSETSNTQPGRTAPSASHHQKQHGHSPADDVAYSLIRNNQFNILVSDTLSFNLGYGNETLFSVLTQNAPPSVVEEAGASMQQQAQRPSSSASASGASGPIVAPYQLINHLPNATALTNRAGLIRSLNRQYSGTNSHVFDTMPTTYFLTAGVRSEAESPTLQQFYRRFNALQHGNLEASGVRMPAKHCERNMWMIKPAACSSGSQAVVVNNAADISTYVSHSKGDIVIQKYVERPLLVPLNRNNHGNDRFSSFAASGAGAVPSAPSTAGYKVSVRLFVLVTDSGDVHVYKAPMVYAAPLPYASAPISQCGSVDEMLGIHVTSPDIHQTGAVSTSSLLNGAVDASAQPSPSQLTLSWAQLQHAIDATHPAGTFPPQVLSTIILPRLKRMATDCVKGAFAAPMGGAHAITTNSTAGSASAAGSSNASSGHPRAGFRGRRCFELFGVDFLLDEDLRPWLLGFNENPWLGTPTARHAVTVHRMLSELVSLVIDPLYPAPLISNHNGYYTSSTNGMGMPSGTGRHHQTHRHEQASTTPGFDPSAYLNAAADTPTGPAALQAAASASSSSTAVGQEGRGGRSSAGASSSSFGAHVAGSVLQPLRGLDATYNDDGYDGGVATASTRRPSTATALSYSRSRLPSISSVITAPPSQPLFGVASAAAVNAAGALAEGNGQQQAQLGHHLASFVAGAGFEDEGAPVDGGDGDLEGIAGLVLDNGADGGAGAGDAAAITDGSPRRYWEYVHRSVAADDVETPAYCNMVTAALSPRKPAYGTSTASNGNALSSPPGVAGASLSSEVQAQIAEALCLTLPPRARSIATMPSHAFLGPRPILHRLAWAGKVSHGAGDDEQQVAVGNGTAVPNGPSGRFTSTIATGEQAASPVRLASPPPAAATGGISGNRRSWSPIDQQLHDQTSPGTLHSQMAHALASVGQSNNTALLPPPRLDSWGSTSAGGIAAVGMPSSPLSHHPPPSAPTSPSFTNGGGVALPLPQQQLQPNSQTLQQQVHLQQLLSSLTGASAAGLPKQAGEGIDPSQLAALAGLLTGRGTGAGVESQVPATTAAAAATNANNRSGQQQSQQQARPTRSSSAAPQPPVPQQQSVASLDPRLMNNAAARARATAAVRKLNPQPQDYSKKSKRWANVTSKVTTGQPSAAANGGANSSGNKPASGFNHPNHRVATNNDRQHHKENHAVSFAATLATPGRDTLLPRGGSLSPTHRGASGDGDAHGLGDSGGGGGGSRQPAFMRGTGASVARANAIAGAKQQQQGSPPGGGHTNGGGGQRAPSAAAATRRLRFAGDADAGDASAATASGAAKAKANASAAALADALKGKQVDAAMLMQLLAALQAQKQQRQQQQQHGDASIANNAFAQLTAGVSPQSGSPPPSSSPKQQQRQSAQPSVPPQRKPSTFVNEFAAYTSQPFTFTASGAGTASAAALQPSSSARPAAAAPALQRANPRPSSPSSLFAPQQSQRQHLSSALPSEPELSSASDFVALQHQSFAWQPPAASSAPAPSSSSSAAAAASSSLFVTVPGIAAAMPVPDADYKYAAAAAAAGLVAPSSSLTGAPPGGGGGYGAGAMSSLGRGPSATVTVTGGGGTGINALPLPPSMRAMLNNYAASNNNGGNNSSGIGRPVVTSSAASSSTASSTAALSTARAYDSVVDAVDSTNAPTGASSSGHTSARSGSVSAAGAAGAVWTWPVMGAGTGLQPLQLSMQPQASVPSMLMTNEPASRPGGGLFPPPAPVDNGGASSSSSSSAAAAHTAMQAQAPLPVVSAPPLLRDSRITTPAMTTPSNGSGGNNARMNAIAMAAATAAGKGRADSLPGGSSATAAPAAAAPVVAVAPPQPSSSAAPVAIWVRVADGAEDAYYYYHSITRETTWEEPKGAGVVIVDQP